eukprot:UN0471
MEEEDNSQGTRVLTAYYQGTRVIEDKTAIFFHNLLLSFLNLIHVGSDLCLQAKKARDVSYECCYYSRVIKSWHWEITS